MKKYPLAVLLLVSAFLVVFSANITTYAMEKSEESSQESEVTSEAIGITGVVEMVDGEPVIISGGVTYYVNGPDLTEHVDRKIAAKGTVETYGDEKTITISEYELLD